MHRTTIAVEDRLLEDLKMRAAREGRSLASVVNDLLRAALRGAGAQRKPDKVRWKVYRCGGCLVDVNDRDALFAAMEKQ